MSLNAQRLFEFLESMKPEDRASLEVLVKVGPDNTSFNVRFVEDAQCGSYGFFGKRVPCLLLLIETPGE